MYKVTCEQAEGVNCAVCKYWNNNGNELIVCSEDRCWYKFSLIRWIKAVFK